MKRWRVTGPEWEAVNTRLYVSSNEPRDIVQDVIEVEAETPHDAKVFAVRAWRKEHGTYISQYDDENPFTGLTVEAVTP